MSHFPDCPLKVEVVLANNLDILLKIARHHPVVASFYSNTECILDMLMDHQLDVIRIPQLLQ